MSWQVYVDDHLLCDIDIEGNHLPSTAILDQDGNIWARSHNFHQVLMAQSRAKSKGFSYVLYLDSVNKKNLEEVSSCNIFIAKKIEEKKGCSIRSGEGRLCSFRAIIRSNSHNKA
ncbi:uncharacterized protein [Cicer arietinum]|uniref:Uncharacterized protein LOC101498763 n=1 Tax=Cicer arietinum TaxID=3827 RepID=A0A1S2YHA7_CICAR|nr:uncharacterized protein LOC101498763 [Cicer arietinum]